MKKQSLVSILITFISSFAFLMLSLLLFKTFGWNVVYKNAFTLVKTGLVYGLFSIVTLYILNFYLASRLNGTLGDINNIDVKKMMKFLLTKIVLDFALSSLVIWLSIYIFINEIVVKGILANLGIMFFTFIFKEIFSLVVSYNQNKDKIGGSK